MSERAKFNWLDLLFGIAMIVLGIFSFTREGFGLGSMVIIYGIAAILTGIMDIAVYAGLEKRTGFGSVLSLVSGILSIIAGMLMLFNLSVGKWVITVMFPIWFIAHCVARLSTLYLTKIAMGNAAFYFALIANILGLIIGIILLFSPLLTFAVIEYIVGTFLIVAGVSSIVTAIVEYS